MSGWYPMCGTHDDLSAIHIDIFINLVFNRRKIMSLVRKNKIHWLFVDVYNNVISVSVDKYPTYNLAVMRAFNKSRGG